MANDGQRWPMMVNDGQQEESQAAPPASPQPPSPTAPYSPASHRADWSRTSASNSHGYSPKQTKLKGHPNSPRPPIRNSVFYFRNRVFYFRNTVGYTNSPRLTSPAVGSPLPRALTDSVSAMSPGAMNPRTSIFPTKRINSSLIFLNSI
jgi:hypothetical protein